MWYLTKEMSAGGLNAQLHVFSDSHLYKQDDYAGQEVFFILEGKAEVTVKDEKSVCIFSRTSVYVDRKCRGTRQSAYSQGKERGLGAAI